jgi:hypothetical protein
MRPWRRSLWSNLVLIACTSVIIAPSMAADQDLSWTASILPAILASVLLRTPGALAEWYPVPRARRWVYYTHTASAILAILIALSSNAQRPAQSSYAASLNSTSSVATLVGVYLFLSSAFLVLAALLQLAVTKIQKHAHRRAPTLGQLPTARAHSEPPPQWAEAPTPSRDAEPHTPSPLVDAKIKEGNKAGPRETIAILGVVTGIASIVQGVDAHNIPKTFVALAVGGVGIAAIYLFTGR